VSVPSERIGVVNDNDEVEVLDPKLEDGSGSLRLGVVCVHGIGRQKFGDTARDVAQAVEAGATQLGGEFVRREPAPDDNRSVVLRASMRFPGAESYEVQFHDGWWDERVNNPNPLVVLRWIWRILPFTLWTTVGFWMFDLQGITVSRSRYQGALRALLVLMLVFGVIIITPILVVALTVMSIMCFIPKSASKISNLLSLWPGDAWLYRSESLDESVIAEMVDLVESVSDKVDVIMLVGHSQGAEISRRVSLKVPVDGCVWVGSGESQLGMLRTLRRSRWVPPVLWASLIAWPATFAAFFNSSIEGVGKIVSSMLSTMSNVLFQATQGAAGEDLSGSHLDEISNDLIGHALNDFIVVTWVLLLFWGVFALLTRLSRHPSDLLKQPDCEVMVVKSLIDPVCFGPNKEGAVIRYVPVARPYHKEHVGYFAKSETGLAILEALRGSALVDTEPHSPRFPLWAFGVALVATSALTAATAWIGNLEISLVLGFLG
jgi:pimeloyl-ACP methyl ester carboxylesterase